MASPVGLNSHSILIPCCILKYESMVHISYTQTTLHSQLHSKIEATHAPHLYAYLMCSDLVDRKQDSGSIL